MNYITNNKEFVYWKLKKSLLLNIYIYSTTKWNILLKQYNLLVRTTIKVNEFVFIACRMYLKSFTKNGQNLFEVKNVEAYRSTNEYNLNGLHELNNLSHLLSTKDTKIKHWTDVSFGQSQKLYTTKLIVYLWQCKCYSRFSIFGIKLLYI